MMRQTRYYKFKLREPTTRKKRKLEHTLKQFKDCTNDWLQLLHDHNGMGQKDLHNTGYHDMREQYDLYSATVQESMNRALQAYKANGGSEYRQDTMSFKNQSIKLDTNAVNIPLVGGREWLPFIVPPEFREYLNYDHGNIVLKKIEEDWFVYISLKIPVPEPYQPKDFIGVDLGIINILTASTPDGRVEIQLVGDELNQKRQEFEETKARLQKRKAGDNNVYRALKRVSGREANFAYDLNHKIAKQVVKTAAQYRYGLAVENLSGITSNLDKETKKARKMLKRWKFRDLIDKLRYKAEAKGVPFIEVDPRGSTKECHNCGETNEVGRNRTYTCENCGVEIDRDLSAARVIAARGREKYAR